MENILGQFAQTTALIAAVFFVLLASSGLFNLYLRYHDRLPIDREDVQALARNSGLAVLLLLVAGLFKTLPFFMAIGMVLSGVVIIQVLRLNGLINKLED